MQNHVCTNCFMMVMNILTWKRLFTLNQKSNCPSPSPSLLLHCKLHTVLTPPTYSITLEAWWFPDALLHNDENIIMPLTSSNRAFITASCKYRKLIVLCQHGPNPVLAYKTWLLMIFVSQLRLDLIFQFCRTRNCKSEQQIESVYYSLSYGLFDKMLNQ